MASARQQTGLTSTEPERVNPNVEGDAEGVATLDSMFGGQPTVVDEVVEVPIQAAQNEVWWVIRPNTEIEDMTVAEPAIHYNFKAGVRYKVPIRVAEILYNRDYLMEVPYPLT